MIITEDRTGLDRALGAPKTTILVLVGSSIASAVHDFLEAPGGGWEAWWRWFLIEDVSVLTSEEKVKWFDDDIGELYAVLGGRQLPKHIAHKGPITDLLRTDDDPGKMKIRSVFLSGDRLQ